MNELAKRRVSIEKESVKNFLNQLFVTLSLKKDDMKDHSYEDSVGSDIRGPESTDFARVKTELELGLEQNRSPIPD